VAVTKATSTRSQSFPYPIFFSPRLKKYLRTHETTETDTSKHARPVSGAVILPQGYTKNGE